MNAPQKVSAWAGAIIATVAAIAAVMGPGADFVREVVAQEAARQMAPATAELSSIKDLLRRQEDRAALQECRIYRKEFPTGEVRERRCRRESDHRWRLWRWQDCVALRGDTTACGSKPPDALP